MSYDQFYTYFKGDTTATLDSGLIFGIPQLTLSTGTPVNLGLPFNTPAGQPCATPVLGTGFVNPACNSFTGYSRTGRSRNSFPTEQISLQSNYFRRLDFSARFNYSDAEASLPDFNEFYTGLTTRTRQKTSGESTRGSGNSASMGCRGVSGESLRQLRRLLRQCPHGAEHVQNGCDFEAHLKE